MSSITWRSTSMDWELSRRYLHAMGVQVWRRREEDGVGEKQERALEPPLLEGEALPIEPPTLPQVGIESSPQVVSPPVGDDRVAQMDWGRLSRAVTGCRACELCETRAQTVFGVGNLDADLMVIGEAPGADEDRQGEPFVGRAGQLLNLMLQGIGLRRDQVYIANILKCRPPGNRDPRPSEALRCKPYLMRQIALVRPRVLLSVGRISAQNLLKTETPIGKLRGRWREFGPNAVPLMVTYHPAYLLRSPDQKSKVWQDLIEIARRLRTGNRTAISGQ